MNRGGALFVDHMQYEQYPQLTEARELLQANGIQPVCPTPFSSLFVGYDGQYYLCCSDWKKEVPLGSVADVSFADVVLAKLAHSRDRGLVCKTCNLDPLNRLVEVMRARATPARTTPPRSDGSSRRSAASPSTRSTMSRPSPGGRHHPKRPTACRRVRTIPVTAI